MIAEIISRRDYLAGNSSKIYIYCIMSKEYFRFNEKEWFKYSSQFTEQKLTLCNVNLPQQNVYQN